MNDDCLASLQTQLGYVFANRSLLQQALTHRSFSKDHNERLEFLGDALLDMLIAEALCERYPSMDEGKLTRYRSQLVKGKSLAAMARTLTLGPSLRLGDGEIKSGGASRESTLANAFEALIAAIYYDSDFAQTKRVVLALFDQLITVVVEHQSAKDAKTQLQEWLQSKGLALPVYAVEHVSGQDHQKQFTVACQCQAHTKPCLATASSKRAAEQKAAAAMLLALESQ